MAERLDRMALTAAALGHGGIADSLSSLAEQTRAEHLIFEFDGRAVFYPPETHLEILDAREAEWMRQAQNLAGVFAETLGKTEEEYINDLPKFDDIKINDVGRFDIPLIVPAHGLSILETAELSGLSLQGPLESYYVDDPRSYSTLYGPDRPYAINISGLNTLGNFIKERDTKKNSLLEISKGLKQDERFLTDIEAIALFLNFKLFPRRPNEGFDWVCAPGSIIKDDSVITIGSIVDTTYSSIFPFELSTPHSRESYTALVSKH